MKWNALSRVKEISDTSKLVARNLRGAVKSQKRVKSELKPKLALIFKLSKWNGREMVMNDFLKTHPTSFPLLCRGKQSYYKLLAIEE